MDTSTDISKGLLYEKEEREKDGAITLKEPSSDEDNRRDTSKKRSCMYNCCALFCRVNKAATIRIYEYFKSYRLLLFALVGGQFLSLLLCGTGVSSQALETFYNIAVPTSQLFLTYFTLALIFFPILVVRTDFCSRLKDNWWRYLILGTIDVEANFLVVLAYKYTSLTSVQLLDSFTIVTVLVLSFIFLRVRYLIIHLVGVAMCIVGIISLVIVDLSSSRNRAGTDPILGDFLCIFGSVLYAISNVAQEYLVKNHSILEWLGFIGFVGSFISGIQLCIFDRNALATAHWTPESIGSLAIFVFCLFLFYTVTPFVMKYSSAAVVNLSLLTADIFALIFGIYLFRFKFTLLYILAFIIILVGIFIFNLKSPPVATPKPILQNLQKKFKNVKKKSSTPPDKDSLLTNSNVNSDSTTESAQCQHNNISKDISKTKAVKKSSITVASNERQGMLVRGPLEPALSSRSYTTDYTESMSYSYGTK